jgi:hypothetical protein
MIRVVCVAFVLALSGVAFAQNVSCNAAAGDKKLAGAAKNSFLKKCEKDTVTRCDIASKEKKLAGAAKNSFTKKCVKDGVG